MSNCIKNISFIILYFIAFQIYAQDTVYIERKVIELEDNPFAESLKKGKMFLSVGANLFTDVTKNQDQFTSYTLDESDQQFNVKLAYGYFIKDTHPIGVGFKYVNNNFESTYETLLLDTVNYSERNNDYIINIFYGVTKPLFGSQRIYLISDPSFFFTGGNTRSERLIDGNTDYSKTVRNEIALGLNVGALFFLWPNMAAAVSVGPVGFGYKWENYFLNGEQNGSSDSFFIRMSPDLFTFQFTISRYF